MNIGNINSGPGKWNENQEKLILLKGELNKEMKILNDLMRGVVRIEL